MGSWLGDQSKPQIANPGVNQNIHLDNLLFSAVPEPSAFALVGLFGIATLARRRRA